jgi:hypothetical protein
MLTMLQGYSGDQAADFFPSTAFFEAIPWCAQLSVPWQEVNLGCGWFCKNL